MLITIENLQRYDVWEACKAANLVLAEAGKSSLRIGVDNVNRVEEVYSVDPGGNTHVIGRCARQLSDKNIALYRLELLSNKSPMLVNALISALIKG